jgi:hypothetical protein
VGGPALEDLGRQFPYPGALINRDGDPRLGAKTDRRRVWCDVRDVQGTGNAVTQAGGVGQGVLAGDRAVETDHDRSQGGLLPAGPLRAMGAIALVAPVGGHGDPFTDELPSQ